MRRKIALVVLVVCAAFTIAANTDRKLTSEYVNSMVLIKANGDTIPVYFHKSRAGSTTVVDSMKVCRWVTFTSLAAGTTCNINFWSPSNPNFTTFGDTTANRAMSITLNNGQSWNSEGLPIFGWKLLSSSSSTAHLQVIGRN